MKDCVIDSGLEYGVRN